MTLEEALARNKELEAKITTLEAEAAKQRGIAENAEKIFKEHSAEVGEARKKAKADEELITSLKAQVEDLNKKILGAGGPGTKTKQEEKEETPDEIEASLTEEQRKVAEAAFAAAPDEVKLKIIEDQGFRLKFFKEARDGVKVVPEVPWKKPATKPAKQSDDDGKYVKGLFDRVLKRERGMPPGGSGTAHRGGVPAEPVRTRIDASGGQGVLGGLRASRETAKA